LGGLIPQEGNMLTFFCLIFFGKAPHEVGFPPEAYLLSLCFDLWLFLRRPTKREG